MFRMAIAALLAFISFTAAADNWAHWRGPNANGTAPASADPPLTWDAATGANIKWKAPIPGRGSSTPIVWGDRIFVLSAEKTERRADVAQLPKADPRFEKRTEAPADFYQFLVLCFDRDSGKLLWKKKVAESVPHEGHHESHSYAGGSATTDGKHVYASFGSFATVALTMDGELVWTRDFGRLRTRLGWGEAVTPVIHKGFLLLNRDQEADSKLLCLDAATGETKWETARDEKSSWNTPLVVEHAGVTQVILNATNRVRSYDLATGKELWSVAGMTVNAIPSVVTDGQTAFAMSGYRGAAAVAIPLSTRGDVPASTKLTWRSNKGTPYVPSPLLLDGRLYFTQANGPMLTVLDTKTGKSILDMERLPGVIDFYASPVAAAGRIYFVDRRGTTVVLKAGSDSIEVLATNKLNDPVDASPAIVGKQMFLRSATALYCIAAK